MFERIRKLFRWKPLVPTYRSPEHEAILRRVREKRRRRQGLPAEEPTDYRRTNSYGVGWFDGGGVVGGGDGGGCGGDGGGGAGDC